MPKDTRTFFERLTGAVSVDDTATEEQMYAVTAGTNLTVEDKEKNLEDSVSDTTEWLEDIEDTDGQLTIDVFQTPAHIIIQAPMAGVKQEDIDVSITQDMITVRGKRDRHNEGNRGDYYYQELYWGSFSRSVLLPEEVDADKSEASFKHGLLTIKLPKLEKEETTHVKVRTKEE